MNFQYVTRRLLIAVTWSLALATWGAIAHFFLGTPELGPLLAATAGGAIGGAPILKVVSRWRLTAPQTASR